MKFFGKKSENFVRGKIRINDEECFFEKRKLFHLFKSLSYKNWKAQNMPLVAGRLVSITVEVLLLEFWFSSQKENEKVSLSSAIAAIFQLVWKNDFSRKRITAISLQSVQKL